MSSYKRPNLEEFFLEYSKLSDDAEKVDYLFQNVKKFIKSENMDERKALSLFLLEQCYKIPETQDVPPTIRLIFELDDFIEKYNKIETIEEKALFLRELVRFSYSLHKSEKERYMYFLVKEFFNFQEEDQTWILDGLCKTNRYYGLNFMLWLEDNGYENPPSKEDVEGFVRDKPGFKASNKSAPEKKYFTIIRDYAMKYQKQSSIVDASLFWTIKRMSLKKGIEFLIDIFRLFDSVIGKKMAIFNLNDLFYGKNISSRSNEKVLLQFAPEVRELLDEEHPIYKNVPEEQIDGFYYMFKEFLDKVDVDDRISFTDVGIDMLFDDTYESAKNVVNECNSKKHLPVLLKILESRYEGVRSVAFKKFFELTEKLAVKLLPQLNNILDLLQVPDEFEFFFSYLDEEIKLKDDKVINKIKGRSEWDIPKILVVLDKFREWFNRLFVIDFPPPFFDHRIYPPEFNDAEEIIEKDYTRIIELFFGALEVFDEIREPEEFEPFLHSTGVYDEIRKKITSPVDKEFLIFMVLLDILGKKYEIPMT